MINPLRQRQSNGLKTFWHNTKPWQSVVIALAVFGATWPAIGESVIPRLWAPPTVAEVRYFKGRMLPHGRETDPFVFEGQKSNRLTVYCDPFSVKSNRCIASSLSDGGTIYDVGYFPARESSLLGSRNVITSLSDGNIPIIRLSERATTIKQEAEIQDRTRLSPPYILILLLNLSLNAFTLWGMLTCIAYHARRNRIDD